MIGKKIISVLSILSLLVADASASRYTIEKEAAGTVPKPIGAVPKPIIGTTVSKPKPVSTTTSSGIMQFEHVEQPRLSPPKPRPVLKKDSSDDADDSDNIVVKLPPGYPKKEEVRKLPVSDTVSTTTSKTVYNRPPSDIASSTTKALYRPQDMKRGDVTAAVPRTNRVSLPETEKLTKLEKAEAAKIRFQKAREARNEKVNPDAGAALARTETKDMDRFKELLAEKVKQKKDRINANPFNRKKEEILKRVDNEAPVKDAPTKRMKENTPGTREYEEKEKIKREKIEKLIKKQQAGPLRTIKKKEEEGASGAVGVTSGMWQKKGMWDRAKPITKDEKDSRAGAGAGGLVGTKAGLAEIGTKAQPGATTTTSTATTSTLAKFPRKQAGMGAVNEKGEPIEIRSNRGPLKKDLPEQKFWQKAPLIKRLQKMTPDEELILDASLSFLSSLKQGVFTNNVGPGPLPTSKKTALINWFELLSVSLPPEWALHETIDDLLDNIDYISMSDDNLRNMLNKHQLKRVEWSPSCSNRRERVGTGFSCGFWKLLHLVSIGIAEHKGGLNLIRADIHPEGSTVFSPLDAADTIYTYIKNFYPCEECKKNFVATYDQCSNNRRCDRLKEDETYATVADWQELAKWLWEVHNDVSVRVLNEKIERKNEKFKFIKEKYPESDMKRFLAPKAEDIQVLFPSLESCVACYKDDGTWDDDAVFLFLEKTYWIGFEADSKADQLLRYDDGYDWTSQYYSEFSIPWILVLFFVAIASAVLKSPQKAVLYRKSAGSKRSV